MAKRVRAQGKATLRRLTKEEIRQLRCGGGYSGAIDLPRWRSALAEARISETEADAMAEGVRAAIYEFRKSSVLTQRLTPKAERRYRDELLDLLTVTAERLRYLPPMVEAFVANPNDLMEREAVAAWLARFAGRYRMAGRALETMQSKGQRPNEKERRALIAAVDASVNHQLRGRRSSSAASKRQLADRLLAIIDPTIRRATRRPRLNPD